LLAPFVCVEPSRSYRFQSDCAEVAGRNGAPLQFEMITPNTITAPSQPSFALRLRSLRRSKGLTQEDVAALTGYSKRAIETWEERTSVPKEMTQFSVLQSVRRAKRKSRKRKETKK
jgi:DNA-binding transcriptional regulator YiaG